MAFFPHWPTDLPLRRIIIRDLILQAHIGVFKHEQNKSQRICINVSLGVPEEGKIGIDDLARTVSYAEVIDTIKKVIEQKHFYLVETLAETLAERIMLDKRIHIIRIRVEKLDILPEAAGVGVEIERSRLDD